MFLLVLGVVTVVVGVVWRVWACVLPMLALLKVLFTYAPSCTYLRTFLSPLLHPTPTYYLEKSTIPEPSCSAFHLITNFAINDKTINVLDDISHKSLVTYDSEVTFSLLALHICSIQPQSQHK